MADVDIGKVVSRLELDFAQFVSGMRQAADQAKVATGEIKATGGAVASTSQDMTQGAAAAEKHAESVSHLTAQLVTTVAAAYAVHEVMGLLSGAVGKVTDAITDAVKAGIGFEDQFADVKKAVDGNKESYAALADEIRKTAQTIPVTTKELNEIATAAGQLGVKGKDVAEFTTVVAELAKSSTLTTGAAANFFGEFGNVTKLPVDQYRNLASTLAILDKDGASTAATISEVALRIAGTGQAAGLSQPQILGWAAAVGNAGINVEAGGTAVARFIRQVGEASSEGGSKLNDLARIAGMTSEQFQTLFKTDANKALESVLQGFVRIKDAGGDLNGVMQDLHINDTREIDALLRLAGAQRTVEETVKQATAAWMDQDASHRIAQERFDTTTAKLQILSNVLQGDEAVAASPLGKLVGDLAKAASDAIIADDDLYKGIAEKLKPAVDDLTTSLTPMVEAFAHQLPSAMETTLSMVVSLSKTMATTAQDLKTIGDAIGEVLDKLDKLPKFGGPGAVDSDLFKYVHLDEKIQALPGHGNAGGSDADRGNFPELQTNFDEFKRSMIDPAALEEVAAAEHHMAEATRSLSEDMAAATARAKELTAEGPIGAKILADLAEELKKPMPSVEASLAGQLEKLTLLLNKDLHPEQAAAQIAKINAVMEQVYAEGNSELGKLAQERLRILLVETQTILTVDRPAEKKAEAEAERERKRLEAEAKAEQKRQEAEAKRIAEAAAREQARLAAAHAEMLHDFERISSDGATESAVKGSLGPIGAQISQGLSTAFEKGAGGGAGAALAKSVNDLIRDAVKQGVPDAEESGRVLRDAVFRAISTKDEGDRASALALVANLNEQIRAQSALTPENLQRSMGQAQTRSALGSGAGGLIDAITKSAEDGGPQNLKAVGDQMEGLRRQLVGNEALSPEEVQAYWARVMGAVNQAIQDGGQEARDTLAQQLTQINLEQMLDAAGGALLERTKDRAEQVALAVKNTVDAAAEQMLKAQEQFDAALDMRAMRENIKFVQEEEIKGVTNSIEAARVNLSNFRQDQQTERSRARADLLEERNFAREIADINKKARGQDTASVGSQVRLQQAAAEGIRTGPVADPLLEAHKRIKELKEQHDRKLGDIKEERQYEDEQRATTRAEAAADRQQEKAWQLELENFRKTQATNVRNWEDAQAQLMLAWRLSPEGPIQRERDARIDAIKAAAAEQDRKDDVRFNKQVARILLLQGMDSMSDGDQQRLQAAFLGPSNELRSQYGLSPATVGAVGQGRSPVPAGLGMGSGGGSWPPSGSASAAAKAAGYDPVNAGPTNNIYFQAPIVGPGGVRTVAAMLRDEELLQAETESAIGGQ